MLHVLRSTLGLAKPRPHRNDSFVSEDLQLNPAAVNHRRTFATLTDRVRAGATWFLDPVGAFLARVGVHPNVLTGLGFVGNVAGAVLLAQGHFTLGGIVILVMAPVDALDGATARARGEGSRWGAFVDSTTDRWTEAITMLALLVFYMNQGSALMAVLVFLALVGSIMVSYTRARAEALGFDAKVGLLSRLERYLVLVPALILGHPEVAVWILAVLANLTAVQRMLHVRRQWYSHPDERGAVSAKD